MVSGVTDCLGSREEITFIVIWFGCEGQRSVFDAGRQRESPALFKPITNSIAFIKDIAFVNRSQGDGIPQGFIGCVEDHL